MSFTRVQRSTLISCLATVGLIIGGFCVYNFRLALIEYNTRILHLNPLGHAVEDFDLQHGRLPTNLDEVVQAGALPASSTIYCSPMQQNVLNPRQPIGFQQCEFRMDFNPAEVRIRVPEPVWQSKWCWSRTDDAHRVVKIFHSTPPPK